MNSIDRNLTFLPAYLQSLDWRGPNVIAIARSVIQGQLDLLLRRVASDAGRQNIELSVYWRNLLATAPVGTAPWFLLPVRHAEQTGIVLLGEEQEEILQLMPELPPAVAALAGLLWAEDPGARSALVRRYAPRQRAALFQFLAKELEATVPPTASRYLAKLLPRAVDAFGVNNSERLLVSVRAWLAGKERVRRMSLSQFGQLPPPLQGALAASREAQQALLSPGAQRGYQQMLASIRHHDLETVYVKPTSWFHALVRGDLDDPLVRQGLDYWNPPSARLRKAISSCRNPKQSADLVAWLRTRVRSTEHQVLIFLATQCDTWVSQLKAMNPERRDDVLNLLNPRLLAGEFVHQGLTPDVLDWVRRRDPLHAAVVKESLSRLSTWQAKHARPLSGQERAFWSGMVHLLTDPSIQDDERALLDQRLRKAVTKNPNSDLRSLLTSPQILRQLLNGEDDHRDLGAWLVQQTRTSAPLDKPLADHYRRLLARHPELLTPRYSADFQNWEVEQLMSGKHAATFLRSLQASPRRSSAKGFFSWLQRRETQQEALPASLKKVLSSDPDWLRELFDYCPHLLATLAIRKLPLTDLLPVAFKSPAIGRQVDTAFDRQQRLKALTWVKNEHVGRPRLAAAREVALLAGVRFAPYLYSLARKLPPAGVATEDGNVFNDRYHTYLLPKRSGGNRTITAPEDHLKALQRALLREGFEPLDQGVHAFGFRKGRSIVDNAAVHAGSDVVVNVDIRTFFPSTGFDLIRAACASLAGGELSPMARWLAAEICSFEGGLPTGAPTSPAIGNIVLERADRSIARACERKGIRYTRYADDLTFSGTGPIVAVLPFVTQVLKELGYTLDPKKTNIFRKGRRQLVTGLVVNEKPNMVRRLRRRLRAAVHQLVNGRSAHWHDREMSEQELLGRLAFLHMTQPEEAKRLRDLLTAAGIQ